MWHVAQMRIYLMLNGVLPFDGKAKGSLPGISKERLSDALAVAGALFAINAETATARGSSRSTVIKTILQRRLGYKLTDIEM